MIGSRQWLSPREGIRDTSRNDVRCRVRSAGLQASRVPESAADDYLLIGGLIASIPHVIAVTARRFVWSFGTNRTWARTVSSVKRIRQSGRRFLCGLAGHDMLRHFEPDRLCLQCTRCGAQTPGWRIDVNPAFRRRTTPVVTSGPRRVTDAPTRHHDFPARNRLSQAPSQRPPLPS